MNDNQDYWCGVSPVLTFLIILLSLKWREKYIRRYSQKDLLLIHHLLFVTKKENTDVLLTDPFIKMIKECLGIVIVARDITDQKRSETELIEASLAELATGIAEEKMLKRCN
jgi:hypothetical protein